MLIFSPTLPEEAVLQCLEMLNAAEYFQAMLMLNKAEHAVQSYAAGKG